MHDWSVGAGAVALVWLGTLLLIGLAGSDYVVTFAILAVVQIGFLLFYSQGNILADGERRFSASLKIVVEVTAIHAVDRPFQGSNAARASDRFGCKAGGDDLTMFRIGAWVGRLLRATPAASRADEARAASNFELMTNRSAFMVCASYA